MTWCTLLAMLRFYTVASALRPEIEKYAREVHAKLSKAFTERGVEDGGLILKPDAVAKGKNFSIVAIATGGTESTTLKLYEIGDKPLVLIATGLANSLAAALEAVAALRARGAAIQIEYFDKWNLVDIDRIIAKANELRRLYTIRGARIGVLGKPSPWLVASSVDHTSASRKLSVEFVNIPLKEVIESFENIELSQADITRASKIAKHAARVEIRKKALNDAYKLYLAIRNLVERYRLDAITVRCFDLISMLGTTACLALSLLNDELIVAGCEGDEQSVLTMLILSRLSGRPAWMANPVRLDFEHNEIMLAHCTAPLNIGVEYRLKTHFETGIGVGIDVVYKQGAKVTLARISGDLNTMLLATGSIIESGMEHTMHCRTQMRVRLDGDVKRLLDFTLGNHLTIVVGDVSPLLKTYARIHNIEVIRV